MSEGAGSTKSDYNFTEFDGVLDRILIKAGDDDQRVHPVLPNSHGKQLPSSLHNHKAGKLAYISHMHSYDCSCCTAWECCDTKNFVERHYLASHRLGCFESAQ